MTNVALQTLLDLSADYDNRKEDYTDKEWNIQFNTDSNLALSNVDTELQVTPYELTEHAWSQLGSKLGPVAFGKGSNKSIPTDLLIAWKKRFPNELSEMLNSHLANYPSGLLVRTYEERARAILSDRYAVVDNTYMLDVARQALELIERQNGGLNIQMTDRYCQVTPDGMHVKITLTDVMTPDGQYGIGCYLGNNEIGLGKIRALPYIQRHTCQNSTVFADDDSKLDAIHRGSGQILSDRMAIAIFHAFSLSQEHLATFLNAQQVVIPNFEAELLKFAKKEGWGIELTGKAIRGTEGHESLFGFINGLTYAAQSLPNMDDRIRLEMRAGDILNHPQSVFGDAVWLQAPVVAEL